MDKGVKRSTSGVSRSTSQEADIGHTYEHDISKMNKPILLQIGTGGSRADTITFWGHEVKRQGHKTPKLDLEIWRRHRSRPVW